MRMLPTWPAYGRLDNQETARIARRSSARNGRRASGRRPEARCRRGARLALEVAGDHGDAVGGSGDEADERPEAEHRSHAGEVQSGYGRLEIPIEAGCATHPSDARAEILREEGQPIEIDLESSSGHDVGRAQVLLDTIRAHAQQHASVLGAGRNQLAVGPDRHLAPEAGSQPPGPRRTQILLGEGHALALRQPVHRPGKVLQDPVHPSRAEHRDWIPYALEEGTLLRRLSIEDDLEPRDQERPCTGLVEKGRRFEGRLPGADDAHVLAAEFVEALTLRAVAQELARQVRERLGNALVVPQPHGHHHTLRLHELTAGKRENEAAIARLDGGDLLVLDLGDEPLLQPEAVLCERLHAAGLAILEPAVAAPGVVGKTVGIIDGCGESERFEEQPARDCLPEAHRWAEDTEGNTAALQVRCQRESVRTSSHHRDPLRGRRHRFSSRSSTVIEYGGSRCRSGLLSCAPGANSAKPSGAPR